MHRRGRTLGTAVAVLRVLRELGASRDGLTTADVAALTGKSRSTATSLVNSLCQEGFAVRDADGHYRLPEAAGPGDGRGPSGLDRIGLAELRLEAGGLDEPRSDENGLDDTGLDSAVLELYLRTRERAYVAAADGAEVVVEGSKGRQGLPRVPGLDPQVGGAAHALAVGKAVLAHVTADDLETYFDDHGLAAFTPRTTTDRAALETELERVRQQGVAVDVEEFAKGFCCVAAPVLDASGAPLGALAVSTTRVRFELHGDRLLTVVRDVAARASAGVDDDTTEREPGRHLRAVP